MVLWTIISAVWPICLRINKTEEKKKTKRYQTESVKFTTWSLARSIFNSNNPETARKKFGISPFLIFFFGFLFVYDCFTVHLCPSSVAAFGKVLPNFHPMPWANVINWYSISIWRTQLLIFIGFTCKWLIKVKMSAFGTHLNVNPSDWTTENSSNQTHTHRHTEHVAMDNGRKSNIAWCVLCIVVRNQCRNFHIKWIKWRKRHNRNKCITTEVTVTGCCSSNNNNSSQNLAGRWNSNGMHFLMMCGLCACVFASIGSYISVDHQVDGESLMFCSAKRADRTNI